MPPGPQSKLTGKLPSSREVLNTSGQVSKKYPEVAFAGGWETYGLTEGSRQRFGLNFKMYLEMCIHVISYIIVRRHGNRFNLFLDLVQRSNIEKQNFTR